MTLEEHARAIEAALQAAADDGYELDNGDGWSLPTVELNEIREGDFVGEPVSIQVPCTFC
ncbi:MULTISPECIES: hypothetical protein [unclassified Streptomyces]|uniref:hypothetical protein n=1 Tax=unclassified Streptomyces TaxID=2593676 RepID=UPI0033C038F0